MFNSRIDALSLGEFGLEGINLAPVLHARWSNDGSGLTHNPQDRGATPATFAATADVRTFTIDDEGLDPVNLQLAFSVRDPGALPGEGPIFRSGLLAAVPASLPGNANGFLSIGFAEAQTPTVDDANAGIAAILAMGSPPTGDPSVTITSVNLTVNPNRPTTWLITVMGAYSGAMPPFAPPGLGTLFFRYSGEMMLFPGQDPFDAATIVTASVDAPGVVFSDSPGGGALVNLADGMVNWFLNLFSPVMAVLLRGTVARAIGDAISADIRGRVSTELGIPANADGTPGPLPAGVTVSVQSAPITGSTITVIAAVGTFGPLITVTTGSGAGCLSVIALVGVTGAAAALIDFG